MSLLRMPRYRAPRSWWQVGWSHELGPKEVRPLRYFGKDLVMWRAESGAVYVQDAHCLHLGANRAVRGWVEGDDLTCPWHGWRWDGEGRNTCIPYSKEGCKPNLRARTYPTQEYYGTIVVWWDPDGGEPAWELPKLPELDSGDYYAMHPYSSVVHRVKAHTQACFENVCDPAHVPYVHGAPAPGVELTFDGIHLHADLTIVYGEGAEKTALTPNGPVEEVVEVDFYGMGSGTLRLKKLYPTIQITSFTPVDDEHVDYYFQQASLRLPGDDSDEPKGPAKRVLEMQQQVITQDFWTWENMTYLQEPNFAAEEAKNSAAVRRWVRQFYPPEVFTSLPDQVDITVSSGQPA